MSSATVSSPEIKPDPLLRDAKPSMVQRVKDLAWLCSQMYQAAPRHTGFWAVSAVVAGILVPIQLWSGGRLVDSIQAGSDGRSATSPWVWLSVIALTFVGGRFLDAGRSYLESVVRERGGPAIQAMVYRQATGIDLAAYEHQGFYDTTGRIAAEMETKALEIVQSVQAMLLAAPRLVGVLILIFGIDWRIGVIAILPILPDVYVYLRSGQSMWDMLSDQTRDRRIATYLANCITDRQAAEEIRLFGLQEWMIDRWSHHFVTTRDELRRKRLIMWLRAQGMFTLSSMLSLAGFLWLLFWVGTDISAGDVTILMSSFLSLVNWVLDFAQTANKLGESSGIASDVRSFVALPTPHLADRSEAAIQPASIATGVDTGAAPSGRIEIEDLRFAYPGSSRPIIDGISLTIPAAQRVAIVGENGAGKTTLLKLMLGLYGPDRGTILLDGVPVHELDAPERQRRLSAVFQLFTRYPFSIADNITLGMEAKDDRDADIERVLSMAGMATCVRDQPKGLDTVLAPDLGGVDLSGGQWQRMAIARAAWRDADVLALDEPTAALDPMAEVAIFRRFAALAEGRTTLLVSHRLGMARLADRILVIEDGQVIEDGTHDNLRAANGRYAELWQMQARWYQ